MACCTPKYPLHPSIHKRCTGEVSSRSKTAFAVGASYATDSGWKHSTNGSCRTHGASQCHVTAGWWHTDRGEITFSQPIAALGVVIKWGAPYLQGVRGTMHNGRPTVAVVRASSAWGDADKSCQSIILLSPRATLGYHIGLPCQTRIQAGICMSLIVKQGRLQVAT